jgi:hypothetical protein
MNARFITAPDKLPLVATEEIPAILIVDSEWHAIEAIAVLCMTKHVKYDFYLFGPTSIDEEWLSHAAEKAQIILVNNNADSNRHLEIKQKLTKLEKSISMGSAADAVKVPMDYIIRQIEV